VLATFAGAVGFAQADPSASGVLLEGTPLATQWFEVRGPCAGPTVVITAGAHGDEIAGPIAAEQIRYWPLRRGRLLVLPRANIRALRAGRRTTPGESPALSNLNRNYPSAHLPEPRGELARAVFGWIQSAQPDWLLDLHEGKGVHATTPSSVGRTLIVSQSPLARQMATQLWRRVNATVTELQLRFTILTSGGVTGGLSRAVWERLGVHSMTLETAKGDPLSLRVRQHRIMVHELLQRLEMVGPEVDAHRPLIGRDRPHDAASPMRIAVYAGAGAESGAVYRTWHSDQGVSRALTIPTDAEEIRGGALAVFDVLVVPDEPPGAIGALEKELGPTACAAIREFVRGGGGYVGWGAGARIAIAGAGDRLGFVQARTAAVTPLSQSETRLIELTEDGRAAFATAVRSPIEVQVGLRFSVQSEDGRAARAVSVMAGDAGTAHPAVGIAARWGNGRVSLWRTDLSAVPEWLAAVVRWCGDRPAVAEAARVPGR